MISSQNPLSKQDARLTHYLSSIAVWKKNNAFLIISTVKIAKRGHHIISILCIYLKFFDFCFPL